MLLEYSKMNWLFNIFTPDTTHLEFYNLYKQKFFYKHFNNFKIYYISLCGFKFLAPYNNYLLTVYYGCHLNYANHSLKSLCQKTITFIT